VEEVREQPGRVARFTPETAAGTAELKAFLKSRVYQTEHLADERRRSIGRIAALFELFVEHPERLPANYLEDSAGQPLHRQVCDYIAGMTDGFLDRTCRAMNIP
jgi:dGTPase